MLNWVIELLFPGGALLMLSESYTFNTIPLFSWYSDFCYQCNYGIRICEYIPNKHTSLQDAMSDLSILPINQQKKYFSLGENVSSFQYPVNSAIDLEVGKYYAWQINQTYQTSQSKFNNYSPIFIFEVRAPDKFHLNLLYLL